MKLVRAGKRKWCKRQPVGSVYLDSPMLCFMSLFTDAWQIAGFASCNQRVFI